MQEISPNATFKNKEYSLQNKMAGVAPKKMSMSSTESEIGWLPDEEVEDETDTPKPNTLIHNDQNANIMPKHDFKGWTKDRPSSVLSIPDSNYMATITDSPVAPEPMLKVISTIVLPEF